MSGRPVVIVTVATASYLPRARVLASSLARFEPGIPMVVTVVDADARGTRGVEVARLEDTAPVLAARLRATYRPPALAMAAKASAMMHALDAGADRVILLDPDQLVLAELSPLIAAPGEIVLVPHLLAPATGAGAALAELRLLQAGVMNGGVLAVSNTPGGRAFLAWWEDRLLHACRHDVAAGMHFDQRWLDLVPGLFHGVTVLREPGIDVAYWNVQERTGPWRLFHFSGFDTARPGYATKYLPELRVGDLGAAAASLFGQYAAMLDAAGK